MRDSPQDVYAKCLPSNRGYPLWFPEPSNTLPSSYRQDGLQIGDVGYVRWDGAFNVLFNITFGPNHALHDSRRLGVSFNIDPIQLHIEPQIDARANADSPGCVITSCGITQPTQISQTASQYEFTPSSAKGAILILPDGATSHSLLPVANERFRKFAMEHAFDWYEMIKEHCGESITNDSLYLITGFYKARSWSLAAFHDASDVEDRHIWVVPREGERIGRDWKRTFPLECRDGPGPEHNGNVNQTVFISGFKIAVRDDVLGWLSQKPEVQPVPAPRPRTKNPCSFVRFLQKFSKKRSSKPRRGANGAADVSPVPAFSQPFHPSDIINQYLLNKDPDALVAVTHDSEWMTLIQTGNFIPDELTDCLEELLSEKYFLVSQPEHSAVYLQGKSEHVNSPVSTGTGECTGTGTCVPRDVLSKSENIWSTGPSTDNFQVVITSIRAEDIVSGFRRLPVGFCIHVQFHDTKWRTENKAIRLDDSVVEWDERIQLPSERSAKVQLSVCASFELSPMLGNGEVIRTAEICVGDMIDNVHTITFSLKERGPREVASPCSSLHIIMERRRSNKSGAIMNQDEVFDWEHSTDLARLTDEGHHALHRYRSDPRQENLAVAIGHFEHALADCPLGHECYAAALCNLARAYFIKDQINYGSANLSTCLSYYRQALEWRPAGHPDRPATLLHLAEVLLYHYGKLGFEESPGEIARLMSEVQAHYHEDSHECRAADLALQTYALHKAINYGSMDEIDKLLPALRQAAKETPPDYFDRLQRLINLVLALWVHHAFCSDLAKLDESIAMHEEAMRFTLMCDPDSRTHKQLLKEKENETPGGGSWKEALATATTLVVPKFLIYQLFCKRLETMGRVIDAVECFHEMTSESTQEIRDKVGEWITAFKSRCSGKLEELGDSAVKYDDAISRYSVALSLEPALPQGLLIKRSKAYIAMDSWEEALSDANEVIGLDPSSPWGYERKYMALQKAGDHDKVIDAYAMMLSKMLESPDPDICPELNTADTYGAEAVIQALLHLNAEVEQNCTLMAESMLGYLKPGAVVSGPERQRIMDRTSEGIGSALSLGLQRATGDDIALFLSVAFQTYVIRRLSWMMSSWTLDERCSTLLNEVCQRLLGSEEKTVPRRWRSLTYAYPLPMPRFREPKFLANSIVETLAHFILVARCAADVLDGMSRLAPFGEKIMSIVSMAWQFNQMRSQVISADFEVIFVPPGEMFNMRIMEIDDYEESTPKAPGGTNVRQTVLCTTTLGLMKRVQLKTGKMDTKILVKAKVVLESFLEG